MEEKLKQLANHIVEKISKEVKKESKNNFYKLGKTVGIGADGSPTSYIDQVAEDVAIRILEKSEVKVNLLSEEKGFVDFGGTYVFVLDPVDGTRNAYRGIPFYSVSLAIGTSKISEKTSRLVMSSPQRNTRARSLTTHGSESARCLLRNCFPRYLLVRFIPHEPVCYQKKAMYVHMDQHPWRCAWSPSVLLITIL